MTCTIADAVCHGLSSIVGLVEDELEVDSTTPVPETTASPHSGTCIEMSVAK
jgi:hypothetical protein